MIVWIVISSLLFSAKRLLRYLHYFQLEEYDSRRFFQWIFAYRAFDTRGLLVAFIALVSAFTGILPALVSFTAGIALWAIAFAEQDPRRMAKVRLTMTSRAKRIYGTAAGIACITQIAGTWILQESLVWLWAGEIAFFQLTPLFLLIAAILLKKHEQRHQTLFLNEAKTILAEVNPYIIGITGSYGKSSTKHVLGKILQVTVGPTFWTAKSINTLMGITREIRLNLKKGTEYALIEMGAYGAGSIQRLCQLTPPQAAIITSIGIAHLERFGSEEQVRIAKMELAQSVPDTGILVCNGDSPGARQIAFENRKKTTLLYGLNEDAALDAWMTEIETKENGSYFQIHWRGNIYPGFTPLLGKTALSNVLGAFTLACALGGDPEYVVAVLYTLEPMKNRLEVKKEKGITYLQDAYNSNPAGFESALHLLKALPGKRRILMTPGMIELGEQQMAKNQELGSLAGTICDHALIVGDRNRVPLEKGMRAGGMNSKQLLFCSTREEAFAQLRQLAQEGDLVLIENDLTDLYDAPARF